MLLHKYFVQHAYELGQTSFSFCHVRLLETGGVTLWLQCLSLFLIRLGLESRLSFNNIEEGFIVLCTTGSLIVEGLGKRGIAFTKTAPKQCIQSLFALKRKYLC